MLSYEGVIYRIPGEKLLTLPREYQYVIATDLATTGLFSSCHGHEGKVQDGFYFSWKEKHGIMPVWNSKYFCDG